MLAFIHHARIPPTMRALTNPPYVECRVVDRNDLSPMSHVYVDTCFHVCVLVCAKAMLIGVCVRAHIGIIFEHFYSQGIPDYINADAFLKAKRASAETDVDIGVGESLRVAGLCASARELGKLAGDSEEIHEI